MNGQLSTSELFSDLSLLIFSSHPRATSPGPRLTSHDSGLGVTRPPLARQGPSDQVTSVSHTICTHGPMAHGPYGPMGTYPSSIKASDSRSLGAEVGVNFFSKICDIQGHPTSWTCQTVKVVVTLVRRRDGTEVVGAGSSCGSD